jgi:hypothetical protein
MNDISGFSLAYLSRCAFRLSYSWVSATCSQKVAVRQSAAALLCDGMKQAKATLSFHCGSGHHLIQTILSHGLSQGEENDRICQGLSARDGRPFCLRRHSSTVFKNDPPRRISKALGFSFMRIDL